MDLPLDPQGESLLLEVQAAGGYSDAQSAVVDALRLLRDAQRIVAPPANSDTNAYDDAGDSVAEADDAPPLASDDIVRDDLPSFVETELADIASAVETRELERQRVPRLDLPARIMLLIMQIWPALLFGAGVLMCSFSLGDPDSPLFIFHRGPGKGTVAGWVVGLVMAAVALVLAAIQNRLADRLRKRKTCYEWPDGAVQPPAVATEASPR